MPPPPLERAALEDFVLGSLAVRADGSPSWRRRVSRSLGWYRRLVGHGAGALLFPLVHDLGYLMIHGEDFEFRALQDDTRDDPRPRALRLSYENALLNALLRDPRIERAREALSRDPSRDGLITRLLQLLLRPLVNDEGEPGYHGAPPLDPHALRELRVSPNSKPSEAAARFEQRVSDPGFFVRALAQSHQALLARDAPLEAADLSEIEHWDAFRGRADLRLTAHRVSTVFEALGPAERRHYATVEEAPEVDSSLDDVSTFPAGGFAELSTRGQIENLVPSELLYLEGRDQAPDGIDLFTLRRLSGEMLYYLRDSGQLKRQRRQVTFAFEPDPPHPGEDRVYRGLRWREPDQPALEDRLTTLVSALALRLARDLGSLLADDQLRFDVRVVSRRPQSDADAEHDAALLSALLEHEVRRDRARVSVERHLDLRAMSSESPRQRMVSVAYRDLPPAGLDGPAPVPDPRAISVIQLGAGANSGPHNAPRSVLELDGDLPQELSALRDLLLSRITGSRLLKPLDPGFAKSSACAPSPLGPAWLC